MSDEKLLARFLPLTEATYYIMLSLVEPLHGYGIMQHVEELSKGRVKLGPGTLYGVLGKLQSENIITLIQADDRKKCYMLSEDGKKVLWNEIERLGMLYSHGKPVQSKLLGKDSAL